MQLKSKYSSGGIGWGWTTRSVMLVVLATIALLVVLNGNRRNEVATLVAPAGSVAAVRNLTMADIVNSGHYPFGAHGFDSLLPGKPATLRTELIGSGHYPFGAHGFDSLLSEER